MTRSISIWVQNYQRGALQNGDGDPEDRWPLFVERIRAADVAPDLVLGCEAVGWSAFGHRQLARAMRDLDMDACPLPPSSSGMPTVLFYRRETMGRWTRWNTDFAQQSLHGFGVATFDVGLPAPLAVVAAHLDPFSSDRARAEAKLIATRAYRYGPYAIVGGDINYPPHSPNHPAPDYASMRPYNRASRTRLPSESGDGPVPVPDRRVTEMLSYSGYVDAAWELYERTGDKDLLRRTGTDDRIDQLWVSAPLRDAVTSYRLLDQPAHASDHHGLLVQLDLDQAQTDNVWEYQ